MRVKVSPQLLLATHRFMATGMTLPTMSPPQAESGGWDPCTIIFNTLWPNSNVRLRTTVPGEEIASGKGDRMPRTVSGSPRLDLGGEWIQSSSACWSSTQEKKLKKPLLYFFLPPLASWWETEATDLYPVGFGYPKRSVGAGKTLSFPATRPWGPVPSRDHVEIRVLKIWKWIVNLGISRKQKSKRIQR